MSTRGYGHPHFLQRFFSMKIWFVVLMLGWGRQGGIEIMKVDSEEHCIEVGIEWKRQATIINNPDNSWLRSVRRNASYQCIYLPIRSSQ